MRASIIILFISSFFCFGSGQLVQKSTDSCRCYKASIDGLNERQNDVVGRSNWYASISVYNEFVLLEESCSTDDATNTFFGLKSADIKKSYPSFPTTVIIKDNCKGFRNFQSFYGYSQPIYISLGVLRI
jgi:hypothetical protein